MFSKQCRRCLAVKELEAFSKSKKEKDGKQAYCRECNKLVSKARYNANPEYYYHRDLNAKYNLTPKGYQDLFNSQDGKCAICKTEGKLVVDHCHETGKVRGLLHNNCNAALGMLKDSLQVVASAAEYLARHK